MPFGPGLVSMAVMSEANAQVPKTIADGRERQRESTSGFCFGMGVSTAFCSQGLSLQKSSLSTTGTSVGLVWFMTLVTYSQQATQRCGRRRDRRHRSRELRLVPGKSRVYHAIPRCGKCRAFPGRYNMSPDRTKNSDSNSSVDWLIVPSAMGRDRLHHQ